MSAGRLLVCPTPIGNLEDITLRVLRALREADVLACEDTRRTGRLLEAHGIPAAGRLVSVHEHNERERSEALVEQVAGGRTVAIVSDAGMPGISDPGFVLVRACQQAGLPVEVLPGPSALPTALVAAGLPAARFRFVGFLPRRDAELAALLTDPEPLVAFESPRRLGAALATIAAEQPDRPVAICRELSKRHEEVIRGGAQELARRFAHEPPRGEIVLVIGAGRRRAPLAPARAAVRALVEAGARRRPAARVVAELTGLATNELYEPGGPGDADGAVAAGSSDPPAA